MANDEGYCVKNFRFNEIKRVNGAHTFIRCFVHKHIKQAVENNDVEQLNEINKYLGNYTLSFRDLPHNLCGDIYVDDEAYEPPLEMAMRLKRFAAFRYILENSITDDIKRNIYSARTKKLNTSTRIKSACRNNTMLSSFDLMRLREKAEDNDLEEIIDIIDNCGEDKEILSTSTTSDFIFKEKFSKNHNDSNQFSKGLSDSSGGKEKINICLIS